MTRVKYESTQKRRKNRYYLLHDFAPFEGLVYFIRFFIGVIAIPFSVVDVISGKEGLLHFLVSLASTFLLAGLAISFIKHKFKPATVMFLLLAGLNIIGFFMPEDNYDIYHIVRNLGYVFFYSCTAVGSATINTRYHPLTLYFVGGAVRLVIPLFAFFSKLDLLSPVDDIFAVALSIGASLAFSYIKTFFDLLTLYIVYHKPRIVEY